MKHIPGILILIFLTTFSLAGFAQTKTGKISGTVIDGNTKTIESATITLLRAKDSSVAKMSVADKTGKYSFDNVGEGSYLVSITAIGHTRGYSETFEISTANPVVTLKTIELVPVAKAVGGVTVTANKPLIEQKIDRMVVNVDAAVTNVGATALEVLEKSPGITVDKDGTISLKGKQNVQVYIDGKPAYLSGLELVNLLSNMSASQLEQIEIMTNPPARYDAAGNSGIINLKTKKNKQKGFNGSATAAYNQGKYWRTNESLNMNYRNGKVNAFMNYSFNKNNGFQELTIHRTYLKADKTIDALFDQVAFMPRTNNSNNLKLGLDYFVNKKTTIGFVASGFTNKENERNYNTSYLKNGAGTVDSIMYSVNLINGKWKNGSINLNLRHIFDSTGRELTADADYAHYSSHNNQLLSTDSYFPNWTPKTKSELLGDLPVDIDIYSAKMDYSHPLKSGWKVEAGLKTSYVNTDNSAGYFNRESNVWVPDYNKTNHFKYQENINAAYLNLNRQFKKWGVQTGLRFENTNYKGHQLGNPQQADSSFKRNYNSLFPTVFVSYSANDKHQFGINVGRRIDRPAYQDLNPFLYFIDKYTYEAGNPFLLPQFSWNTELSHTYKSFLTTTLNYSRTTNLITETFEQSEYATIVREGNIGIRHNAGVSVSAQVKVKKWWTSSLYGNYNYSQFKGRLYDEDINIGASNIVFNVNNQFRFGKGWSAELSGWYRTKGIDGQIVIQPMGAANAGVSKQVLKGKGTIRLNIRDIFLTQFPKGNIDFQRTQAYFTNRRDSRVAGIAFTWRFGKPLKTEQNNRKTGGSEDEQNRVKME
jgi:iron complex outermembrane recepter protein